MLAPAHGTDLITLPGGSMLAALNPLDWVLLVTVSISTVMAFARGLIRSVIAFGGVLAGIVTGAFYAPEAGRWLQRWIAQPAIAETVAFLGILAACYLVAVLLGKVLRGACKAVGLGFLDRLAGAAFGFVRAVLVISAVIVPAAPFLPRLPFTRDSVLLPYLRTAAHGVSFVLPRDFGDRLSSGADLLMPAGAHRSKTSTSLPGPTAERSTAEGDAQ